MEIESFVANWGSQNKTWRIEKERRGAFSSYFFYDDLTRIFFCDLFVKEEFRHTGLGFFLINFYHKEAKELGFKESLLGVDKGSWMEIWYKKLGYEFHSEKCENENWLIKKL